MSFPSGTKTLDDKETLKRGVIRVPVPSSLNCRYWAKCLSSVTPLNAAAEDGEYAFYRNILDDPEFPFSDIVDGERLVMHSLASYDILYLVFLDCVETVSYMKQTSIYKN